MEVSGIVCLAPVLLGGPLSLDDLVRRGLIEYLDVKTAMDAVTPYHTDLELASMTVLDAVMLTVWFSPRSQQHEAVAFLTPISVPKKLVVATIAEGVLR